MRKLAALTIMLAVACSDPAPAEPVDVVVRVPESTDWTEPGGRYGADFARFAWRERAHDERPDNIVEMIPLPDWGPDAYCAIWESQRIPTHIPQADVNAAMDSRTRETAISANIETSDLEFWHDTIDGISTVDMRFHDQRFYQRWRIFRLSSSTSVSLINFVCGARLPTTTEQERAIDAIVETLHFFPEQP